MEKYILKGDYVFFFKKLHKFSFPLYTVVIPKGTHCIRSSKGNFYAKRWKDMPKEVKNYRKKKGIIIPSFAVKVMDFKDIIIETLETKKIGENIL